LTTFPDSTTVDSEGALLIYGAGIIVAIILLTVTCYFVPWKQINWGTISTQPARTVTVTGQAISKQQNQIATFTAGVSSTKDNKQDATNEVTSKINAIVEAAKAFGIKTEDIKTQYISVYQNQEQYYEDNRQKVRPGQWNVSNSVSFTLRDVSRAGSFTDTLSKAGATNINGPQFSMDQTSDIENSLLGEAITNAKKKAELVAKGANKKLGDIIAVTEGSTIGQTSPIYLSGGGGGGGGGMEAGSATVEKIVTVVFELK
jgi:uncharacterized protein YggE